MLYSVHHMQIHQHSVGGIILGALPNVAMIEWSPLQNMCLYRKIISVDYYKNYATIESLLNAKFISSNNPFIP